MQIQMENQMVNCFDHFDIVDFILVNRVKTMVYKLGEEINSSFRPEDKVVMQQVKDLNMIFVLKKANYCRFSQ